MKWKERREEREKRREREEKRERREERGVSTVENKGINYMALLPALLLERGVLAQDLAHVGDTDAFVGRQLVFCVSFEGDHGSSRVKSEFCCL